MGKGFRNGFGMVCRKCRKMLPPRMYQYKSKKGANMSFCSAECLKAHVDGNARSPYFSRSARQKVLSDAAAQLVETTSAKGEK